MAKVKNMINLIKEYLKENGFDVVKENEGGIEFVGFCGHTLYICIKDSIITFKRSLATHKEIIAQGYKIETYDDFLFVVEKTIASPMFKIDVDKTLAL